MPILPTKTSVPRYLSKYQWPKEALDLIDEGLKIPMVSYTDKQATDFVTKGLAYFERTSNKNHMFNALGSDQGPISVATVYGTDDANGALINKRWRWLPLIEGFDGQGNPYYHTSIWEDGSVLKSMDVLRLDYYYWHNTRFFVPTAIVRPVQSGRVFGQGLQFFTVYEYPTSLAPFLRQPTLASAQDFYTAVQQNAHQWLALLSPSKRQLLMTQYQDLTPMMIFHGLGTIIHKPGKHDTIGTLRPELQATFSKKQLVQFPEPRISQVEYSRLPYRFAGEHESQHSTPASLPGFFEGWLLRQPTHLGIHRFVGTDQASARTISPFQRAYLHQGSSSSMEEPSTELRLGRSESLSHVYAPAARRLESVRPSSIHPSLQDSRLASSLQNSRNTLTAGSRTGRSGFTPWLNPT